ncbi:Phosphoesterase PA-phosphatase related protein [Candidatus Sulfotelmatomonas gaucii]|uniref:Phosphoesterase PA-phosphatase related protein n=1 Tax=Candidatus Sulfuritelmatomonas gaucii TaxID=2043161 RepID=A0A2N9L3K2_9BACT|nr:Phosphoesterase PA-phosphatase related protein [Candidatus Sulfotelmatomonas gaucii]
MTSLAEILKRSVRLVPTIGLALTISSCTKSIPSGEQLGPLTPISTDANAGTWKMIVLSGPTQIPVVAPAAANDPTYLAELQSIANEQANLNDSERTAITYWGASGVLRWNEILRDMVAANDLPPEPNADGTYPAPDPNNPFSMPTYPFSNPPYAVRAYSYVAIAEYEALKVAWYYKFLYNRLQPYQNNNKIQLLMPATGLPSYPSEDAVEAGVNSTLLSKLFPTGIDEITNNVNEQQEAVLLSGRASASDWAAGFQLGQAVANIFLARANNDGMKAAAGNAAEWAQLAQNATAQGQIPWISLEIPPRPPMLPLFGQVETWILPQSGVVSVRPGPPPSTSSPQMQQELAEVKSAVENITRDQLATVYKWNDGANSVTPPGHWNAIAVPYISSARFSEVRAARTLALLNMALHDAGVTCWDTKYAYFNPRPSQLDPSIKVLVALPNFPSYISGHSDFSAAAADVLGYIFPTGAGYFNSQAQEAAMSRLYGGIHYPSDIKYGLAQGKQVADFTVNFAESDGAN